MNGLLHVQQVWRRLGTAVVSRRLNGKSLCLSTPLAKMASGVGAKQMLLVVLSAETNVASRTFR